MRDPATVLELVRLAAQSLATIPAAAKAQLPDRMDQYIQIDDEEARSTLRSRLENGLEKGLSIDAALFDLSSRCLMLLRRIQGDEPSDLGFDDVALLTARLQEADEWREQELTVPWRP